ncbi:MAG: hypothetical protein JW908_08840 [Anaerolineales bacterium]|nr:hypothetical protein [Anaerolineales bacterium]
MTDHPNSDRDNELLKRFEPIVWYTDGEKFFPIAVEQYISQCSLWAKREDEPAKLIYPQGELSVETLRTPQDDQPGTIFFLKFIEPLDLIELARYSIDQAISSISHSDVKHRFRRGIGRLARVGYSSRLIDSLYSLTLFFRGRVPGDTAAAAALAYQKIQAACGKFTCYGRVLRENGWIILQYWYFYPFNNWRSGFFGVNDHEGDWEMVCIYCSEAKRKNADETPVQAEWVAYASHDFSGDDLRRHWQDPEVKKMGDHPIIFAGAGSHASYFSSGEYLSELELPFLSIFVKFADYLEKIWINTLKQAGVRKTASNFNVFRVPFVDYARGDGKSIGAYQDCDWQLKKFDENTPWAVNYRGLWGLYAQDPIAGENAPAGPVYNRDGSVRRSWYDPLGWAGLDKVPPMPLAHSFLNEQRMHLLTRCQELKNIIDQKSEYLYRYGVEAEALQGHSHLEQSSRITIEKITLLSAEIKELRQEAAEQISKLEALDIYDEKLRRGEPYSIRGHIRRPHQPSPPTHARLNLMAELLAAGSIGFLMIGIVGIIMFARQYTIVGLAIMVGFLLFMEASFRRRLPGLISSVTVGLAIIAALVIIYEFFWQMVVIAVLTAGVIIIWENLQEIRF